MSQVSNISDPFSFDLPRSSGLKCVTNVCRSFPLIFVALCFHAMYCSICNIKNLNHCMWNMQQLCEGQKIQHSAAQVQALVRSFREFTGDYTKAVNGIKNQTLPWRSAWHCVNISQLPHVFRVWVGADGTSLCLWIKLWKILATQTVSVMK